VKKYREYKEFSYPDIEKEILEFWEKNQIFEKSISTREGKQSFTFYEGPPSANGMPGIHHVMARTIKDIFCRFKTLQGYQVKRKAGWDTHGLPVELQVEKELGIIKDDIGKTISIEDYNQKCRETVMKFTDAWEELTRKMGYWVDMKDPYVTYHTEYMESVWWLLKQIYDKGLLYKGYTIQPYSPKAGSGLSSNELNMPGCYKDVTDTTIIAQFKVKTDKNSAFLFEDQTEDVRILAWTTTPWTLPSNSALTVGANISYVKIKTYNPYTFQAVSVVLAKDLVPKYFNAKAKDLKLEDYKAGDKLIPYQITSECKGRDLVGIRYEQLLPYVTNTEWEEKAFRVIAGDFVTTEDGTGVVHTAPTFGADDFRVAQQNQVPAILVSDETGKEVPLVDKQGKFRPEVGELAGRYVKAEYEEDETLTDPNYKSTDVFIAIKLKEENKAFLVEKYKHSYPHCWRTDKPILYYPLDSWFIKTTAVKDKLATLNKSINWKPESTGTGRFGNWLENLVDWNLSRQRYWGIPLPIWRTEDGQEEICIGSVEELVKEIQKAQLSGKLSNEQADENEVFLEKAENYPTPSPSPEREGKNPNSTTFSEGENLHDPSYGKAYFNTSPEKWKFFKEFARTNRKNPTEAEKFLWSELRGKKMEGLKFRRQHAIEDFIVDFVSLEKKLVIEVDGEIHAQQQEYDQMRTEFLNTCGFHVIRFSNDEVINHIKSVLEKIKDEIKAIDSGKLFPSPSGEGLGVGSLDLHRPYIDKVTLVSPKGNPMVRETDLMDVWFDSGSMPYAQYSPLTPEGGTFADIRENYGKKDTGNTPPLGAGGLFPADFISEGVDQTRGWFFTLHAIAGMVFDSIAFKNVVSTGLVLDEEGQKMSKRLGNAVEPLSGIKSIKDPIRNEKKEITGYHEGEYYVEGALSKFGADATRWYMIANANPWDNLKFSWKKIYDEQKKEVIGKSEGIEEVQRKFFGTLKNTYNFFASYANLDNFRFEQKAIPLNKRPESDRWIISKLNTLIQAVENALSDYDATKAARFIQDFTNDDLSNWYVRLNRKRFWKSEYNEDKKAAYQTLYTCLETIVKLASPIMPFYAERIFLDLNEVSGKDKNESIHLSDFPQADEKAIDKDLEQKMDLAQRISSLTHSLRKTAKVRVRQPLKRILVPVLDAKIQQQIESVSDLIMSETNVKAVEFVGDDAGILNKSVKADFKSLGQKYKQQVKEVVAIINGFSKDDIRNIEKDGKLNKGGFDLVLEDVQIISQEVAGFSVQTEGNLTVALDIELDDELRKEGIARDFVNRVQNLRKDSGLEVQDKINIDITKVDAFVKSALDTHKDYICVETQALKMDFSDALTDAQVFEIEEYRFEVKIEIA
jgi:isoleucyl-tRNA synthetase